MLSEFALNSIRTHLKNSIAYAKYRVGSTYYQADIEDAAILDDGRVSITFIIDHTVAGDITVTEVQLYDSSGNLWASKAESILRQAVQEGILYRFSFTITES